MNTQEYYTLVVKQKIFIRPLGFHSNLEGYVAQFLALHPLTLREEEVYEKLITQSKRIGFILRKIVKTARLKRIPTAVIDQYVESKKWYKTLKTVEGAKIRRTQYTDPEYAYHRGREETRLDMRKYEFHQATIVLIKCVLEKSINDINNEVNS